MEDVVNVVSVVSVFYKTPENVLFFSIFSQIEIFTIRGFSKNGHFTYYIFQKAHEIGFFYFFLLTTFPVLLTTFLHLLTTFWRLLTTFWPIFFMCLLQMFAQSRKKNTQKNEQGNIENALLNMF